MMKKRFKTSLILLLLVLSSCQPVPNEDPNVSNNDTISPTLNNGTLDTNEQTTIETDSISADDSLSSEERYFHSNSISYGTTNGNANNNGLAVFDHNRELHYFAISNSVYSFNPKTNKTEVLFSYLETGHLQNLCLLDDDLYFVSTQTNYLYRYNLVDKEVYSVYEEETNKVYGYNNTIFANIKRLNYKGEMALGLATYNHGKKQTTTKYNLGTTLVNVNGSKLYYNDNYGLDLNVMADAFNGKTNIFHFSIVNFKEMTEMQLFDVSIDALQVLRFVVLLVGENTTGLYLYSSGDDSLLKISEVDNIHSVNSDGEYIYFISESNLYRYHVDNQKLEAPTYLFPNAKHIFVLNHWLYFSNSSLTTLHRMNPSTKVITSDFWL